MFAITILTLTQAVRVVFYTVTAAAKQNAFTGYKGEKTMAGRDVLK